MEEKPLLIFLSIVFILFLIDSIFGDSKLFLLINRKISNPILDFIYLKILTPLFSLLLILPLISLFKKEERNLALTSLISGFLSYLLGHLLKNLIARPRPFEILSVNILGPWHTSTFSFPSTTAALAFGLALPFFLKRHKFGPHLLTLSFLVGFSVIYTGFHFPLDVIAGAILAFLISVSIDKTINKVLK
jgi:undecaprenyl-diphosphatase